MRHTAIATIYRLSSLYQSVRRLVTHQYEMFGLALMALTFGSLIGFFQIHNADVWWHIAWGKNMVARLFPAAENFYFTPISSSYLHDLPTTFLGDIGLALLHKVGGVLALQLLVLVCLFFGGACVILLPLGKEITQSKNRQYLALFLFFGFCLGTSQLQLVRNSLFSLLLFPLVLGIYSWHVRHGGWKVLLFYPAIFLTWSCMHSSYILGMISLLMLYSGLLLDSKNKRSLSRAHVLALLVVLLLTMSVSLTYSYQVRYLLTTPITHSCNLISEVIQKIASPSASLSSRNIPSNSLSTFTVVKPLWNDEAKSGDFIPTWKILRHPAAWSSLLLSFVALLLLLLSRIPNKRGMLLFLGSMTYFGICYFRGTGYATVAAVFVLASTCVELSFLIPLTIFKRRKKIILLLTIISFLALLAALYLVIFKKSEFFFMERGRVFGYGKAAPFEDATYDFVKNHFLDQPCFTTVVTGSYALLNWNNQKKVFIDAFFAPHTTTLWNDYNKALKEQSLACLDQYGIQVALIENSRLDWQSLFLNSREWIPVAIGTGTTLYAKQKSMSHPPSLDILFTLSEIEKLPSPTARRAAAAAFYNSILALQLRGNGALAGRVLQNHPDLFQHLADYLSPSQRGNIRTQPPGILPSPLLP